MTPELEKQLFNKYPKIFKQKDLSCQETCMCWGIDTPDTWYNILDELCFKIQFHVDMYKIKQIEAVQVKEKYGYLRFYTNYYDEKIEEFISEAERKTCEICAICGSFLDVQPTGGWIDYLCKLCRDKYNRLAYSEEEDV